MYHYMSLVTTEVILVHCNSIHASCTILIISVLYVG